MGATASTLTLSNLTAEEVGKLVAGLGGKFATYESIIVDNGLSGEILASLSDDQIKGMLTDCNITNTVHQTVLLTHFNKLKGGVVAAGASNAAKSAAASSDGCQFHALPGNFEVGAQVTKQPRSILCDLFQIQGIGVDPTDLDPAVEKIVKAVGGGFGDGKTKYDCFINYRVASDSDLAEKLYLYLATKGIYAFLDKKCLKNGEKWKEGFLTGLKNSKCFVALISKKALDRVRDKSSDHTYDNVLLEYETALNIMSVTNNPKYICPLHVGECSGGNLAKFQDFNPALYPDSITAIMDAPPAAAAPATNTAKPATIAKAAPPPAPAADDHGNGEGEEEVKEEEEEAAEITGEEMSCQVCALPLSLHSAGTWSNGWGCDWPGHEGENHFTNKEPVYGCPTIKTCNWGVCQTCWNDFHESKQNEAKGDEEGVMIAVDQPEGTKSAYNESYYCEVEKLVFKAAATDTVLTLVVYYNVRGDMSLGPLQDPKSSSVYAGDHKFTAQDSKVYFSDAYQNKGELYYHVTEEEIEMFTTHRVVFEFGSGGYSSAVLTIPNSEYKECVLPICSTGNHIMIISDYHDGPYASGYCCDICRGGKSGFRWFCSECSSDKCFSCEPLRAMFPKCNQGHDMERCSGNKFGGRRCDVCRRTRLQNDPEFYHCTQDNYDLCLGCASSQQAEVQAASG